MPAPHARRIAPALVLLVLLAACGGLRERLRGWNAADFTTNESLYRASLDRYEKRKWADAVAGFERLTLELPARDTLLPRAYWYLAQAHARGREHLLAAQGFI